MKRWRWHNWAILAGYCAGAFFLCREFIIAAVVLEFFPVLVVWRTRCSTHRAMADYISDKYPDIWNMITDEQYNSIWGRRDLIFVRGVCDDPEYLELRKQHKRAYFAHLFSFCAFLATSIYAIVTSYGEKI